MVELAPIRPSASAPSRPIRANSAHSNGSRSTKPGLTRVHTAQHLDDTSVYHHYNESESDDDGGTSEDLQPEDDEEARKEGLAVQSEERMGVSGERDLEAGDTTLEKKKSSRSIKDPNLVTWNGPGDAENPLNWTMRKKWAATVVVSSFTFISPVSSSMVAPAISSISREFGITNEVEQQLLLSVFVLAYAVGPLILGPFSEIFGRVPVLQLSNLFFLVFNIACGFSKNKGQMIAFRFLSGLGGSAPLAVSDHFLPYL